MAGLTKRPMQIYLEERQERVLRRIAKEEGVSLSELIRRSIDLYLENLPVEDDPALKIVGLGRSGLGDLAEWYPWSNSPLHEPS